MAERILGQETPEESQITIPKDEPETTAPAAETEPTEPAMTEAVDEMVRSGDGEVPLFH